MNTRQKPRLLNVSDDMPVDTTIAEAWADTWTDRGLPEHLLQQNQLSFYDGVAFMLGYLNALAANRTVTNEQGEAHMVRLGEELIAFANNYLRKYG